MSNVQARLEAKRIMETYPSLTNFMQGAWNEQSDLLFSSIDEAVEWYMRLITERMGRDFLDEVERASQDQGLRTLMRSPKDRIELTSAWGGVALLDEDFSALKTAIQRCLDEGIFVSKQEEQRRAMRHRWR